MTWPFLCILEKSSITKKFDRKVAKCKQYKRIPWNKEHVNCFLTIDCNVNLLLVHKINQKTLLKPSSPEPWRMTIAQQQQKRKILSLGQLLRENHIACTPQSNSIRRPRPRPKSNSNAFPHIAWKMPTIFWTISRKEARTREAVISFHNSKQTETLFQIYISWGNTYPPYLLQFKQHSTYWYLYIPCT